MIWLVFRLFFSSSFFSLKNLGFECCCNVGFFVPCFSVMGDDEFL